MTRALFRLVAAMPRVIDRRNTNLRGFALLVSELPASELHSPKGTRARARIPAGAVRTENVHQSVYSPHSCTCVAEAPHVFIALSEARINGDSWCWRSVVVVAVDNATKKQNKVCCLAATHKYSWTSHCGFQEDDTRCIPRRHCIRHLH